MADDQGIEEDVLTILNGNDPGITDTFITIRRGSSPDDRRAIGEALAQNPHVEDLTFFFLVDSYDDEYEYAYTRLGKELETRRNLECVHFSGFNGYFPTAAPVFRRLLNSVQQNPHVASIRFGELDIVPGHGNLFSFAAPRVDLVFSRVRIAPSAISTVTAALREQSIGSAILCDLDDSLWMPLVSGLCNGPDPLSQLDLWHATPDNSRRPVASFNPNALLQAAAAFRHEVLSIRFFPVSGRNFDALIDAIPNLRADTLVFVFFGQFEHVTDQTRVKQRLLAALKANYSFLRAELLYYSDPDPGQTEERSLLNQIDEARVDKFSFRNERLRLFVKNPKSLPPELWTWALHMVSKAGLHARFDSCLQALPQMFSEDDKEKK